MSTKFSLKIKNYKSFGEEEQGFEKIMPINVIIGRNNSGKSALVDAIEALCGSSPSGPLKLRSKARKGKDFDILLSTIIGDDLARNYTDQSGEDWLRENYGRTSMTWMEVMDNTSWPLYKEFWEGRKLSWFHGKEGGIISDDIQYAHKDTRPYSNGPRHFVNTIVNNIEYTNKYLSIYNKSFKRLGAERDLVAEDSSRDFILEENGLGATNLSQLFEHNSDKDRDVFRIKILEDLNHIFQPDAYFSEITTLRDDASQKWEIFLHEESKGLVPLSASGSGLKTILLVLIIIHLVPKTVQGKEDLSEWIFAFEELENNLHPALQRRLFNYLREKAIKDGATLVLTTHSPIVVDLFAKEDKSQIIHVTHDGIQAYANSVLDYKAQRRVLDDLDIRASDLLQSNGIVWVEGPTDRMYFNEWIRIWSKGMLLEGVHYQCVIYGGRLIRHIDASGSDMNIGAVDIMRVNRNAVLIADSDRAKRGQKISESKKKVIDAIEDIGGMSWVTHGREIEHYLPNKVIESMIGKIIQDPDKYESYRDYLNKLKKGWGDRFQRDKISFASEAIDLIDLNGLSGVDGLPKMLNQVCSVIRKWSDLPDPVL